MDTHRIALNPENLTATYAAGVPLAQIATDLQPFGLFWPGGRLLPNGGGSSPGPTLGDHLDAGTTGPWRLGWGTSRDWVLGMQVQSGSRTLSVGGSVVKNVAGLNLTRLLIGAGGTLARVLQATLRLAPLPDASVTLSAAFSGPDPGARVQAALAALPGLLSSRLNPAALDFVAPATLLVTLEGSVADLPRRTADAQALLAAAGGQVATPATGAAETALWAWRAVQPDAWGRTWGEVVRVRCGVPARLGADLLAAAATALADRPWAAEAQAGNGIWRLHMSASDPDTLASALTSVRAAAGGLGGYLLVEAGPSALAERIPFRAPHPTDALQAAIRMALSADEILAGKERHPV